MPLPKKPPLLFTVGTALLLIGGGAIAYGILNRPRQGGATLPAAIQAVPQTAVFTVSLSTDPEQWQQLRRFGTDDTQAAFDQQLARWRDRWLTSAGLSFEEHLQPWVGTEGTLALLPEPVEGAPPESLIPGDQHRLLLLPIADVEAAQTVLPALPLSPEEGETINYRGVSLDRYPAPADSEAEALWIGRLGTDLVLITDAVAAAEQAIDTYKGGQSVANLPGYRRAVEQATATQPFGKLYINVPAATQLLAQSSQPPLPPAVLSAFQTSRGLVASLELVSKGLRIQSVSWLLPESDRTYQARNLPTQLPQLLPADTLAMASGSDFQQFWSDLNERQNWGALTALNPDSLALALQSSTGLTVEDDLLPWMAGEFALALVPPGKPSAEPSQESESSADPEAPLPSPGLVVLTQASDRPLAEKTFAQLDDVMASRYRFDVKAVQTDERQMTEWVSPFASLQIMRGWLENNVAFMAVGQRSAPAIADSPDRPLASTPLFQWATAEAPYPNNGHFFLNLQQLNRLENNLFLSGVPEASQVLLQAIQGIGLTTTVLDERRLRYDLSVALERGDRPGPLPPSTAAP